MGLIKISKVEVQKNHNDRVSMFVDDAYFASMYLDTAVKYGIKKDLEIEEETFKKYIIESEKHLAFDKAVNYQSSAFKTKKQIRDYLNKKGYDKIVVDYVIDKMCEYKFLDDEKFADMYISSYDKKYGPNMLKTKLLQKGISKTIVDEKLKEYEPQEEIIDKMLLKKLGSKPPTQENLTKCIRFLSSRGYDYDNIKKSINKIKKGEIEDYE